MILKTIKEKKLNSIIKKKLSQRNTGSAYSGSEFVSALCLINFDEVKDIKQLYKLAEELEIEEAEFKIIGYVNKIDKTEPYPIAVFSDNSILITGSVNNFKVNHYLEKEYDLVINYYNEKALPLLLISALANARFRIGLGQDNTDFNDLTLKGPIDDFEYFKEELVKYLKILNKK